METREFDQIAAEYEALHARNITVSGESPEYFARYKVLDTKRFLGATSPREILDFGSGVGNSLPHFHQVFPDAEVICADVSRKSLDISQQRFPTIAARYVQLNEDLGQLADHSVDLSFSACVFHHIAHEEHIGWLAELARVTRAGGSLVIFEHNPMNPLTLHAVSTCEFDKNARLIRARALANAIRAAGWKHPRIVYRIFFPHFLASARPLEKFMTWLPLGAQYAVVASKP